MKLFLIFLLMNSSCLLVKCYRILGVFPAPSHSHFTLGFRLMKEFANRGHQAVYINSYSQKGQIKNFRDISVKDITHGKEILHQLPDFGKLTYYSQLKLVNDYGKLMSEVTLNNKNVQKLIKSNEKFDLVILEHFFNEALFIFAHRFKCPIIVVAPGPPSVFNNYLYGNPAPSSYVTNLLTSYDSNMNFWKRLNNMYMNLLSEYFIHYRFIPTQNSVLQAAIPGSPDLSSLIYNSSLMFIISHISLDDPVPLQQNIKQIGGYHVLPANPLAKDLQEFMDNSTEGVVVFSMGSNIKSHNYNADTRKAILNAFSKIKQKVLWKFEEELPEKPSNVKILDWLPQSDVLAHPNTVAFISHGGLLGTTEAVYHGVPILGLPVYWDQGRNIKAAVRKGFGLKVNFNNLDGNAFEWALNELLNNSKYSENAKKHSLLMHDQPIKPMEEAVYWCEYVIRHKGAKHLRSAALDLRWYEVYLLDIFVFLFLVLSILCAIIGFLCKKVFGRKRDAEKIKKK